MRPRQWQSGQVSCPVFPVVNYSAALQNEVLFFQVLLGETQRGNTTAREAKLCTKKSALNINFSLSGHCSPNTALQMLHWLVYFWKKYFCNWFSRNNKNRQLFPAFAIPYGGKGWLYLDCRTGMSNALCPPELWASFCTPPAKARQSAESCLKSFWRLCSIFIFLELSPTSVLLWMEFSIREPAEAPVINWGTYDKGLSFVSHRAPNKECMEYTVSSWLLKYHL